MLGPHRFRFHADTTAATTAPPGMEATHETTPVTAITPAHFYRCALFTQAHFFYHCCARYRYAPRQFWILDFHATHHTPIRWRHCLLVLLPLPVVYAALPGCGVLYYAAAAGTCKHAITRNAPAPPVYAPVPFHPASTFTTPTTHSPPRHLATD